MDRFIIKNGSTINISSYVRKAVVNNQISYTVETTTPGVRLDFYANKYYNDPSMWWLIAAASGIGWWLQMPPGRVLYIPNNLEQIKLITDRI